VRGGGGVEERQRVGLGGDDEGVARWLNAGSRNHQVTRIPSVSGGFDTADERRLLNHQSWTERKLSCPAIVVKWKIIPLAKTKPRRISKIIANGAPESTISLQYNDHTEKR
jgi:hypothetical protein